MSGVPRADTGGVETITLRAWDTDRDVTSWPLTVIDGPALTATPPPAIVGVPYRWQLVTGRATDGWQLPPTVVNQSWQLDAYGLLEGWPGQVGTVTLDALLRWGRRQYRLRCCLRRSYAKMSPFACGQAA